MRDRPDQRQLALAVVEERAEVPVGRVLAAERVAEDQRVPGNQAGVVRDHQRGAGGRDAVHRADRGPPPGGVEQLDERLGPLDQPRVHAVAVEPRRRLEQPRQVDQARQPLAERRQQAGDGLAELVARAGEVVRGEPGDPVLQPVEGGVEAALHLGDAGVGGRLEAGRGARLAAGGRKPGVAACGVSGLGGPRRRLGGAAAHGVGGLARSGGRARGPPRGR